MSKQSKHSRNQKYISRFRIKNRVATNPEQHQKQPISYFSKVDRDRSVLNVQKLTKKTLKQWVNSKVGIQSKDGDFNQLASFNSAMLSNNRNNETQVKLDNYSTSKSLREQINQNSRRNNFNKTIQTNQSMHLTGFEVNKKTNRKQYLSYYQYEQMVNNGQLKPIYFQKIAHKNDSKVQKSLELQTNQSLTNVIGQNNSKRNKKIQSSSYLTEGQEEIYRIRKNKSTKQLPSLSVQKQMQTILSTKLGVLSNDTIRKMLEQRQEQQIKCKKSNFCIFTQQSDIISDRDAKSLTLRDEFNSRTFKKIDKKQIPQNKVKKYKIQEIENQKYRAHLKRIFEIKENVRKSRDKSNLSEDENYQIYEKNMFQYNCIYKPKRYVLKHKLEWKV